MLTLLVTAFVFCISHLNTAKQLNADVSIHHKDILLFSEEEIWARKLINKTSDIIQLNVVIDESKAMKLLQLNKDIILHFDVIHPDVEQAIQQERTRINSTAQWTPSDRPEDFFLEYRSWSRYLLFIEDFVRIRFPNIASESSLGTTVEGRNIPLITLSTDGSGEDKPGLYIQAVVHAREWVANAATMYIMNAFAEGYGTNGEITAILDAMNIYIVPTVNIDGYIYSYDSVRMWRKNRRDNGGGTYGVDINRNYDGPIGTWCTSGASSNPNSDTYCGTAPFSEPETQAIAAFVNNTAHNIQAGVDMHTSGPLILWPWGYTVDLLPADEYNYYFGLGADMQRASAVNGQDYRSMPAAQLYPAAGAFEDYVWSMLGITGFTFEGRGPGFSPPPSNIIPAGQEQLEAILVLAKSVLND